MEAIGESGVHKENTPFLGREVFNVGEAEVRVSYSKFTPERKEALDSERAVIFLPGWGWSSHAKATWDLPRWLASEFDLPAYNIDTLTSIVAPNTLKIEAEAVRQFITSKGLKEVTVFGHSEGAIKAANLTHLLEQRNPDVQIFGVVLANPMGFYPQNFGELAKNFVFVEIAQIEPKQRNPKIPHMSQLRVLIEFLGGLWQDVKASKLKYPWMFTQQMREMMRIDPVLEQIKAPILILTTDKDFVSNYRRYLPELEIEKRMGEFQDEHEKKVAAGRARRAYLGEHLLPNANPLGIIVASKYGSHIGLPVERYKVVAHVVSRIFDRMRRNATIGA